MPRYQIYPKNTSLNGRRVFDHLKEFFLPIIGWAVPLFIMLFIVNQCQNSVREYKILDYVLGIPLYIIFFIFIVVAGWGIVSFLWNIYKDKRDNVDYANNKATQSSSKLNKLLEDSLKMNKNFPILLNRASKSIQNAKHEFKEKAYAPFWDEIEHAAQNLYAFNDVSRKLSENVKTYYSSLQDQNHDFPAFVMTPATLPNPNSIVDDFQKTVRMAQKDFQFASIWEQRQTRKVLMAGFHTLGEAINNLGITLVDS